MTIVQRPARTRRRGLHRIIVDQLGLRIVRGELPPGSVLPNEAELSRSLEVSRTVVREAMKVLAAKGLVESRPRTGTRVLARTHWDLIDGDVLAWTLEGGADAEFFRNISEVRAIVEPRAAALAALRRTPEEAERIVALLAELDDVADQPDRYTSIDLELHAAILRAAHNELLAQMIETIAAALRAGRAITVQVAGGPRSAMAMHRQVVLAVRDGDAERARAGMEALVLGAAVDAERVLTRAPAEGRES
jgi:DNA-binding FadR family transcriptional regulator